MTQEPEKAENKAILTKQDLTPAAEKQFAVQSYEKAPTIDGVTLKDVSCFVDDGGYFLELGRFNQGLSELFPDFQAKQMSYSMVLPGAVKAFHVHFKQDEYWFVAPHERLLMVLSDQRDASVSQNVTMRFVLGGGKSRLLFIPKGVAHGVANIGQSPASIIYFTSEQFVSENPDEGRLPWDFLGSEIWGIAKG